jgi:hypothetical protein
MEGTAALAPELRANARFVMEYKHFQRMLDDADAFSGTLLDFSNIHGWSVKGMNIPEKQIQMLMPWSHNRHADGYFLKYPNPRLVLWLRTTSLDAIANDIHARFTDSGRMIAMFGVLADPAAVHCMPSCVLKQNFQSHVSVHPCEVNGKVCSQNMYMVCQWLAIYFKRVALAQ